MRVRGCLVLIVVVLVGGPLLLLIRVVQHPGGDTMCAFIAVTVCAILWVFLLRWYKQGMEQRFEEDRYRDR